MGRISTPATKVMTRSTLGRALLNRDRLVLRHSAITLITEGQEIQFALVPWRIWSQVQCFVSRVLEGSKEG